MSSPENNIANVNSTGPKRSLVLAGGGARLAYQAGVIKALEEEGLSFCHFDGTSGGIFNTAMLSSGVEVKDMGTRWRKVNVLNFSSLLSFKSYFSKSTFAAFGDADGMIRKVYPTLGINVARMNANTAIDATFNVCNFSKKTIEVFTNRNVTLQHLVAGMSLPIFMPALKINGDWYTDAVWIKDANLGEAIRRKVKEIWLVWAIGNTHEFLNGAFNQYVHMIEISANGGLLLELDQLAALNNEKPEHEKIILHVIKPEFPLPLDPDLMFNRINADELINRGYAEAKSYLQQKTADGVAPDYKASMMNEPGAVLAFRALFSGKMVWKLQPTEFSLNVQFNFRKVENKLVLRAFASVSFGTGGYRISTCNNQLTIDRSNQTLRFDGDFLFEDEVLHLACQLDLISQYDLLLGMEFKKARCSLSGQNNTETVSFILKQKAWSRLKNGPFIHVNSASGWIGKWKEKFRILNEVYEE